MHLASSSRGYPSHGLSILTFTGMSPERALNEPCGGSRLLVTRVGPNRLAPCLFTPVVTSAQIRAPPGITMAEKTARDSMADGNQYHSPDASPPATGKMSADKDKENGPGCLVLFVCVPLIDAFGVVASYTGPYHLVMRMFGLGGFACGVVLGAYVSARIMQQRWWSSSRWAIYGLVGMCLATLISFAVVTRR